MQVIVRLKDAIAELEAEQRRSDAEIPVFLDKDAVRKATDCRKRLIELLEKSAKKAAQIEEFFDQVERRQS